MPELDFPKIPDADEFSPLPEGQYLCRVIEVKEMDKTEKGYEQWRITFEVIDPKSDFLGKRIWDRLFFSPDAMSRIKLVCSRLGLDTTKKVDLETDMLLDKVAKVTVINEEYETEDEETGKKKTGTRNKVPFAGYESVEQPTEEKNKKGSKKQKSDELPF